MTNAPPPSPAPGRGPKDKLTEADLLAPFDTAVEPVRRSALYPVGLFVVAVSMVLLPLVYVALVLLMGYGLYWHITENHVIMQAAGAARGRVIGYLAPIVIGGVGLLFMIKPLFAPRGKRPPTHVLTPETQPILFRFVERLCRAIGAPVPRRIDVSVEVNASASFRRGFLSMIGSDLVLTIGLPLVGGTNLRQFAGVLAHEFGHFSQAVGMRLSYVIASVNGWFARVVYERDAWDETLVSWSENAPHGAIAVVLMVARLFVWLTRRVLWVLMMVGHVISCFMSRQMEFDADTYHTRISGSNSVRPLHLRLTTLSLADQGAHHDLQQSWRDGRLGDDLPALIIANLRQLQSHADTVRQVSIHVLEEKTALFDTHPATSDRIAAAERQNNQGIFHLEFPSQVLFRSYPRLCKEATLRYYREMLGPDITTKNLVQTEKLVAEQTALQDAHKTLYRYFQGKLLGVREVFPPYEAGGPPKKPQQALEQLRASRDLMLRQLDHLTAATGAFEAAEKQLRNASLASTLLSAHLKVRPRDFELTSAVPTEVQRVRSAATSARQQQLDKLNKVSEPAMRRLVCGLQLLHVPKVFQRVEDAAERSRECQACLETLTALKNTWSDVLRLRETFGAFALLLQNLEGNEESQRLISEILRLSKLATQNLREIRATLERFDYPFEHAKGQVTVAGYMIELLPTEDEVGLVYGACEEALDKLYSLYYRCMAQLAVTAEKVEAAVGLQPLPDPPEEEPAETSL